ncbi:PLP-dependent aminotransferase family protein [Brevibacterium album]|uniref:MocR-like pyridoxine biosynthesis transcription factor PdxR n=1 Tax=Brevibacterium album TaxID=417948 RepID=UPI000416FF13|nr:PLP-dependent aminotransferase family protein [Brevibacterium album]
MRHPFPMDLVLDAERSPGIGAREHLVEQLRAAILAGQVEAAEPLPSTRSLATAAGVSRGTAVAAYEELAGEGYVTIVPGSGTFVTAGLPAAGTDAAGTDAAGPGAPSHGDPIRREPPRRTPAPAAEVGAGDTGRAQGAAPHWDLSPGLPASSVATNREWAAARRRTNGQGLPVREPDPAGEPGLRAQVAAHLRASRGVRCEPEDIVATAGTSDGLGLLVHALRAGSRGEVRIATENPGHRASRRVMSRLGAVPVPVRVRDGGMDVAALSDASGPIDAVLVTPSHQYPLGGRLPVAARLEMLEWARTAGALIIEDDYDSEFRHGAPPLPAISSLDREQTAVLVGSFSKTLSPWLRCGYLLVPDPVLRERILDVRDALGQPVSGALQAALGEFLRTGGLRRHLARVGREYAHRRGLVREATAGLAPHVRIDGLDGGLHAALSWRGEGPADEDVVAVLAARGIAVTALSPHYHGPGGAERNGIVLGYGAPADLQLRSALRTVRAVLTERVCADAMGE